MDYSYEVNVCLNARFQPVHRHLLEDAIDEILQKKGFGEVDGGGITQMSSGEIDSCEIVLLLRDTTDDTIRETVNIIDHLGVPKGSQLRYGENTVPIGDMEGLALYLNGTDLPPEVYKVCDINAGMEELERLVANSGRMYSYWEGARETGLYFYGGSYKEMAGKIQEFLAEYPLCAKCRVEQIA